MVFITTFPYMKIPYIAKDINAKEVAQEMDQLGLAFTPIDKANWQTVFPYTPEVGVRMAYTDSALLLHYKVREASVRAHYKEDNGNVWTDSCVEFFCIPANDGIYYNLECNCIGTILLGAGKEKKDRQRASQDILNLIDRWSSLGTSPFEECLQDTMWEVALVVPFTAFYQHHITSLKDQRIKANFYKCGDDLSQPHFLSWSPISLPKPNFHCPAFFGELEFA